MSKCSVRTNGPWMFRIGTPKFIFCSLMIIFKSISERFLKKIKFHRERANRKPDRTLQAVFATLNHNVLEISFIKEGVQLKECPEFHQHFEIFQKFVRVYAKNNIFTIKFSKNDQKHILEPLEKFSHMVLEAIGGSSNTLDSRPSDPYVDTEKMDTYFGLQQPFKFFPKFL